MSQVQEGLIRPDFLESIEVPDKIHISLMDNLSNWMKVHKYCSRIRGHRLEENILGKLIIVEINTKARIDIIGRLKNKYDIARKERENREIYEAIREAN